MIGLFTGALLLGRLSDVLGRRITTTISVFGAAIAQIAGGLAQNWATYAITRFLAGIGLLVTLRMTITFYKLIQLSFIMIFVKIS